MSAPRLIAGAGFGRFQLVAPLGQGATGEVWRARDESGREVALKVLLRCSPRARQRFAREGQLTAGLAHPGILTVHEAGEVQGVPYLVYELVEGHTFDAHLEPASRAQSLELLLQVAEAVGHAHLHGVVHRDLKPANILVGRDGRARVADFGLAAGLQDERLTHTGVLIGTPHFLPPERLLGSSDARSPATDVWALGVLLYRVLCGRLPFTSTELVGLIAEVSTAAPPPPRSLDPTASPALEALCLRALTMEPSRRPPDAQAFARALRAALRGEDHALLHAPRRRLAAGLVALAAAGAVVAGVALLAWPTPRAAPPASPSRPASPDPRVGALEEVLRGLPGHEARGLLDSPRRWRSEACQAVLGEARRAREAALLDRLSEPGLAPAEVTEELRAVSALIAAQAPGTGRPATTVPLVEAVLQWTTAELEARRPLPLEALEAAAELGVWSQRRGADACLVQVLYGAHISGSVDSEAFARALVACHRLDSGAGPQTYFDLHAGALPQGDDPWSQFMRTRTALGPSTPRLAERLRALLLEPPPDLVLGPRVWTEAACAILGLVEPGEREALLRIALARDPRHPTLHLAQSYFLQQAGDVLAAVEASERCVALLVEQGYDRSYAGENVWTRANRQRVELLITAGLRERAIAAFPQLRLASGWEADLVAEAHPWIVGR